MDQRLLNSSKRPVGPETPFMTTEKQMASIVCGIVATAQIINVAETQYDSGRIILTNPVSAKQTMTASRLNENQGIILTCRWRNHPRGSARNSPVIAGIHVSMPTWNVVAWYRARKTGRNGDALLAIATPIASIWTLTKFWGRTSLETCGVLNQCANFRKGFNLIA